MALLVRKVSRAKWPCDICSIEVLPGDAISDLRTSQNALSLWRVDSVEELENAIIALATAPKNETIEKMHIAWFTEEAAVENGLTLRESPGDTAAIDLLNLHRDITKVNYSTLGIIAQMLVKSMEDGCCKLFNKTAVKNLVKDAFSSGKIDQSMCSCKLLEKL